MLLALLVLSACAPETDPGTVVATSPTADHLYRASLALRGIPPLPPEMATVRRHPDQLETVVRGMLDDERFAEGVRDHHALTLQLRGHIVGSMPPLGPLAGFATSDIDARLAEAPLHLVADIVTTGRPYTEILTTDRTFVDPVNAIVHGLPHDPDGPEWQPAVWSDGRPTAGLLSDTAVLQRYQSSLSNHHRARAAMVLSELMCSELLAQTVDVAQIGEPDQDIVRTDPACMSCHAALDPMASAFWGFDRYILAKNVTEAYQRGCPEGAPCYPLPFYRPDQLGGHEVVDMPPPAWKGVAVDGIEGLGQTLAADRDFAVCTARRFHGWHTGRAWWDVDDDVADELADVLVGADYDARELVVASVLHDDFVAAPRRVIRPGEYARTLEALTGFRWSLDAGERVGTVDLATSAKHGFRTLLGGTDGWDVLAPARTPTPSATLARESLALEAAASAVQRALQRTPDARTLFAVAPPGPMTDEVARGQLVHLHDIVLGLVVAPDDPAIDEALDLLRTLEATSDPITAWAWMLATLLQHDRLVLP